MVKKKNKKNGGNDGYCVWKKQRLSKRTVA